MKKRFIQNLKNISIKYKLFLSYLLLIVVPLSLFITITLYISSTDARNKALESAKKVLSQASAFLEYKTSTIKNVMDIAVLDTSLQAIVSRDSKYYLKNVGNGWIDNQKFYTLTFNLHSNPDISNICLYMKDGIAAVEETNEFKTIKKIEGTDWYKSLLNTKSTYEWLPAKYFSDSTNPNQISFLRKIPSDENINDFMGIIKVDIDSKVIKDLLSQAVLTNSASVILTNNKNELISYSGNPSSSIFDIVSQIKPNDVETNIWKTITVNSEKMLIGVQTISRTDMKLAIIVPYKDILDLSVKLRNPMITILIIIISLIIPLSFLISTSGTKRIRLLIKHIKKVQNGKITVLKLPSTSDEIGDLINNFNFMIDEIAVLIDDKFKLGKELKNIELKALQAQINPHFLYNTLDLINWMSMKYDAPEIKDVVNSLSKFYKLSLSKGADIITLENEIELVIVYIQIQNMRFENKISYTINIPNELYQYTIPKITLQPLVENCILHGILEKDEAAGAIVISGEINNDIISIFIQDDGVGMSEEQTKEILEKDPVNIHHGYGICNIDDRLKLIYGNEFGLTYSSNLETGTTVTIRIPAKNKVLYQEI